MAHAPVRDRLYRSAVVDSSKWDLFEPRDDDIIVCSSYKAGTTWMQAICAALIFQQPQPPLPQDKLSPWFDANHEPTQFKIDLLNKQQHRRYIKTHCAADGIKFFDEVKYIFVGRDGRDTFMSLWNHWHNLTEDFIDGLNNLPGREGPELPHVPEGLTIQEGFDQWLQRGVFEWEQDGYPFGSHFHHAQTWWDCRHFPNVHIVHFDELLADIDTEMRRIADFLEIPVNEENWQDLLNGVSFKEMKKNAARMAPGGSRASWRDSSKFFNKGVGKRWVSVLSPEQVEEYERVAAERMDPELAKWMAGSNA